MKLELSLHPEFSFPSELAARPPQGVSWLGAGQQHAGSHYKVSYTKLWNDLNLGISGMFLSGSIIMRWISLPDFSVIFGVLAQSKESHCDMWFFSSVSLLHLGSHVLPSVCQEPGVEHTGKWSGVVQHQLSSFKFVTNSHWFHLLKSGF